jgi:hypothetical protein
LRVGEKSERQQQQMKWLMFRNGIGGVRKTVSCSENRILLLEKEIEDWRCGVVSLKQVPQIPRQTEAH